MTVHTTEHSSDHIAHWRADEHPIILPAEKTILPVAGPGAVRRYAGSVLRRRRGQLAATVGLYTARALAGLATPALFGEIVERVVHGTTMAAINRFALAVVFFVVAEAVLFRFASLASARLGEGILAELREDFVARAMRLPLSTLERAGTGDLVSRSSRDVGQLATSARWAVPSVLVAVVTALLTIGALIWVSPLLALPMVLVVPILWASTRWYLRRAPAGYLRQNAAWADVTDGMTETVEGARTVEALRLGRRRRQRTGADIARQWAAERYTLRLRTVWYPIVDAGYLIPVAVTLLAGGYFYQRGWVDLGQVTAATLYVRQLMGPIDELLSWLDELQVGSASLARLLGVAQVPPDRKETSATPAGEELSAHEVTFAYSPGKEVLHGIDLDIAPGERLAVVGPSGAGKSTLGRLLAGIAPPTAGSVTVGRVPLIDLPVRDLRRHVALVSQEHHVFLGTLRENAAMAKPDATETEIRAALSAVDALDWALALPEGFDTKVGSGATALTAAQAQQLALARLVLADPHTLVLDEATSLIDPRAARHLERSLAAVLSGRTVIAIAHRLYTAHDADRVAVVDGGRITELGSHDQLLRAGGPYATLWDSWHGR